jgi:hypothetical protein
MLTMTILKEASHLELQQMLELFPVSNLKQGWPNLTGEKSEVCDQIATKRDVESITAFIDEHIGSCRQHVYIFAANQNTSVPETLGDSELIAMVAGLHSVFVGVKNIVVIMTDTLERKTLRFLWPVKVQISEGHLIVRFVTLEKDIAAHVSGAYIAEDKGLDENDLLSSIGLMSCDIHKGIKKLWDDNFMDCPRLKYIDPESTTETAMKEARGIRKNNSELYDKVKTLEIVRATFFTEQGLTKTSLRGFAVEPSKGYLAISRYSETKGDSDYAIVEIIKHNQ